MIRATGSSRLRVLLLGSTGLLGGTLEPFLVSSGYEVKTHGRDSIAQYQADLRDSAITYNLLEAINPDVIVNLIGLTNVDGCEAQPNEAFLVNIQTVENIVGWIQQSKSDCHLVHISTDQVYDSKGLHIESNVTLSNYYAYSKYAGELAACRVRSTILRTNFFGRSHRANRASLTDWLYQSLVKGDAIQVFEDVKFSPLSMYSLSQMIELSMQKKPVGIFNLGSHEGMSKADFAYTFADELGLPTSLMTRTTTDKVTFLKTYRPKNMRMDCSRFEKMLGINLPFLRNEIKRVTEEYL